MFSFRGGEIRRFMRVNLLALGRGFLVVLKVQQRLLGCYENFCKEVELQYK